MPWRDQCPTVPHPSADSAASCPGGQTALPRQLLTALLPCSLAIAVAILPLQGAAISGYAIQGQWHHGEPGLVDPVLPVVVFSGTLTVLALAWGPLAAGRGSGADALEALQAGDLDPLRQEQLTGPLRWPAQLRRLPLLLLSHLAGLAVGIESPAASFGASALLSLRPRLAILSQLPLPLLAAVGGGAGLGTAFRSPLLGVIYALECLGCRSGLPLVLPTLLLAGLASLLGLDAAVPARLSIPLNASLPPTLLPWALLITLLAALVGVALRRSLLWLTPRLQRLLHTRFLPTSLLLSALVALLAHLSGGISLNDGSLDLGPALAGHPESPGWAALPRLLSPLLAAATGVPGGLPLDAMSLGGLVVAPLVRRLAADQQAVLIALGAAAVFSASCRTPLLAGFWVFVLQGNGAILPLLLMASAVAACVGVGLADPPPGSPPQLLHGLPPPARARFSEDRPSDGEG